MNIPEGWKRINDGDSIKEYLTVLKVGKGDYEVTATHGGLIAKLPSGGFEFRPDKHPGLDHFFVFSGKTFATGWRFVGMRCTHFSNGEPMGSSFPFGVTNTSEEAPQPVAWMSRCIKGDRMGTVEQCEPDGPNNREYWSAAFPVYTHADAGGVACPPGHELVALPIDGDDSLRGDPCETVDSALTMLDFALSFALCNREHVGTRRDVKKAQRFLEQAKALRAADAGEVAPECFCVEHGMHIEQLRAQLAEQHVLLAQWLSMFQGGISSSPLSVLRELTRKSLSASAEPTDEDRRMNPCKQGHRDVGAAGGVAHCYTCDEKITASTTQEAFEQWNATHQAAEPGEDKP
ncbi:hypothetical protein [Pseudomonas sp. SMN5]|uniref:hypothetical protein n=1 Tax=Pseudomonas sp. SMN5 TaxID=3390198 RepID=UPI003F846431